MLRRITGSSLTFSLIVVLAMAASHALAQFLLQEPTPRSGVVAKLSGAEIDWGAECYYATGQGVMPPASEEPDRTRAYLKAKSQARTKAVGNLLMAIEGSPVSCAAAGKDLIARNDLLRLAVESCAAGAEIVWEKQQPQGADTVVLVTVRAPMFGPKTVGAAILRSKFRHEGPISGVPDGLIIDKRNDHSTPTAPVDAVGLFTSLIVDCSGLGIERALCPVIRRADGSLVWSATAADSSILLEHGVVAYSSKLAEAEHNSRAGSNPLVIRPLGRAGSHFMCDAVISDPDADRMIAENKTSNFLGKLNVLFVVDGD